MLGTRKEIARLQSDFYRDKYRSVLRKLLFSANLIVILLGLIIYLVLSKETPRYYATTTEGKIIPMKVVQSK